MQPFAWQLNHDLAPLFDMVHFHEYTCASVFQAGTLLLLIARNVAGKGNWPA